MVQVVSAFKKGRNRVSYFGRTAKIFMWSIKNDMKADPNSPKSKFVEFTKLLNPDMKEEVIKKTFVKALDYSEEIYPLQIEWIEKHHDEIIEAGLQVSDIGDLLNEIYAVYKKPSYLFDLIKLWKLE